MSDSDNQPGKIPTVQSEAVSQCDPPETSNEPQKKKDAWDKAQIVSGFISSVVIAAVGILINISIQRSQITASEASTRAQIEVTERNNKAQLALTERTADIQKHLQEGTLTGQLAEHLAGGSTLKKQIAIVVLRRSIPPDMYQDVITVIVKSDTDPEVRKTALEQARTLRDVAPSVAQAIAQAAIDSSRSVDERKLARDTVRQLGLVVTAPANTFVLSSSGSGQDSFENAELRGGVFTYYLLRGLSGEANVKRDGNVQLTELSEFVISRVKSATELAQIPVLTTPASGSDPVIVGPGANYSKTVSVVIGNSNYYAPNLRLKFGVTDAASFADFWQSHGARTHLVFNATRAQMQQTLKWATAETDSDSLERIYYSGHAVTEMDGTTWLFPVDGEVNHLRETSISTAEIRDILSQSSARTQVLFLDASFSAGGLSSIR